MSANPWVQKFGTEEHNPDFDESGKPYYGFIFGHSSKGSGKKFPEAVNFIPQGQKVDENGYLIKSHYPKPGNEYQLEILSPLNFNPPTVGDKLVHSWKTCNDQLQQLETFQKSAVNALKKWLNTQKAAVWFHDGQCGDRSEFGGPHLHVVIESAKTSQGNFCRANAGRQYQDVVKAIRNAGGYYRSTAIKDIDGYVTYCSAAPREFLGTRSNKLARYWKQNRQNPKEMREEEIADPPEVNDAYESFGEVEGERPVQFGECNDSDDDICTPQLMRQATANFGLAVAQKRSADEAFQEEAPTKDFFALSKESASEKYVQGIIKLMDTYNVYDKERLKLKAFENANHEKYLTMLISKRQFDNAVQAAIDIIKVRWSKRSLLQMAEICLQDKSLVDNELYLSLPESMYAWFCWAHNQFGDVRNFVATLCSIVDRKSGKQNTLLLVGASNTGKSFFFNKPLQKVQPMKTLVGNMGNASPFMWEKCQGQRLIFIDECRIDASNIETAKLVFGGEEPEVGCKGKIAGEVLKTPVICSGNVDPWTMAKTQVDKEAMMNRCVRYTTQYLRGVPRYTRDLSPHIWWYLVNSLDIFTESSEFTLANINAQYPETVLTQSVPEEDPEEIELD